MKKIVIPGPDDSIQAACEVAGKGGYVLLDKPIDVDVPIEFHLDGHHSILTMGKNGRFDLGEVIVTVERKQSAE